MKQDIYYTKAQQRMKKGILVRDGFLGDDKRNLIDIITEDVETLKRLELTKEIIANALIEFRDAGIAGLGEYVPYKEHFEVRVETFRGKLPCPFGDKGVFQKTEIVVRNKKINEQIIYSELSIHLIK